MAIDWAIYGGAVCAGALAAVAVQWGYNEWCWRLDRGTVVLPSIKDPLAQLAALNDLLAAIRADDDREGAGVDYEEDDVALLARLQGQDYEGEEGLS
jgi:hypothetical protein